MKKINLNLLKGVLFFIISLAFVLIIPDQISIKGENGAVTSRTYPYLVFGLMMLCSMILIIKGIFSKNRDFVEITSEALKQIYISLALFALIGLYIFLIDKIGYVISSVLAVNAILLLLKCRKWVFYIICNFAVLIIFFGFSKILNVFLPSLL